MPLASPVFASLLFTIMAVPLILNKIPKNYIYGFRTSRTMSGTDEEWYRVNHHAGVGLFVAGLISLLACLLVPHIKAVSQMDVPVCTGILIASLLVAVGYAYARHGN